MEGQYDKYGALYLPKYDVSMEPEAKALEWNINVTSFLVKSHLHPSVLLPFRLFSILHLKDNEMKRSKKKYGIWRNFRRADKRALVSQQR